MVVHPYVHPGVEHVSVSSLNQPGRWGRHTGVTTVRRVRRGRGNRTHGSVSNSRDRILGNRVVRRARRNRCHRGQQRTPLPEPSKKDQNCSRLVPRRARRDAPSILRRTRTHQTDLPTRIVRTPRTCSLRRLRSRLILLTPQAPLPPSRVGGAWSDATVAATKDGSTAHLRNPRRRPERHPPPRGSRRHRYGPWLR